jgi:hypothetical protein
MLLAAALALAILGARAQPACDAPASPPVPAALRGVAVSLYTQNISVTVCDAAGCAGTCAVFAADVPLTRTCVPSSSPAYFVSAFSSSLAPPGAATVNVYTDAACATAAVGTLADVSLAGARGCTATSAGAPGGGPLGASAFALGTVNTAVSVDESSYTIFYAGIGFVQRNCYASVVTLSGAPAGAVAAAGQLVDTYLSGSGVGGLRVWTARWSALLLSGNDLFTNSSFAAGAPAAYGDAPPPGFIGTAPFDPAAPPAVTTPVTGAFVPGAAAVGCDTVRGELLPAALRGQGELSAPAGLLVLGTTGYHYTSSHTPRGAGQSAPWSTTTGHCIQAVAAVAAPANTWQVTVGGAGVGAAPLSLFYCDPTAPVGAGGCAAPFSPSAGDATGAAPAAPLAALTRAGTLAPAS